MSQPTAERVAQRLRRHTDDVVHEYYCRDCQAWHVGQKRQAIGQERTTKPPRTERLWLYESEAWA